MEFVVRLFCIYMRDKVYSHFGGQIEDISRDENVLTLT